MGKLAEPHVLLASGNPNRLLKNLGHILSEVELDKIRRAVDHEVFGLYQLGMSHYYFASSIGKSEWRQKISRLYYAAYNVKRAIQLKDSGVYSTDSSDHQRIDELPKNLENAATYKGKLKNLRDDRNLADYSHVANEGDLLIKVADSEALVDDFITDAKKLLEDQGIVL